MIRNRVVAVVSVASVALISLFAGIALAVTTTTDLGSLSVDVKQVSRIEPLSVSGIGQSFQIACPADYEPIGGGGFVRATGSNNYKELRGSYPYDNGTNKGWSIIVDGTAGWDAFGYAICMKIG